MLIRLHFGTRAHVSCTGKGRKQRITPLTAGTAAVLRTWMTERDGQPGQPLFPARTGSRLSRDAIEHRLAKVIAAVRSLGIASSIVPARVSRSRARYSLREFTRISKDREVVASHHGHTPD